MVGDWSNPPVFDDSMTSSALVDGVRYHVDSYGLLFTEDEDGYLTHVGSVAEASEAVRTAFAPAKAPWEDVPAPEARPGYCPRHPGVRVSSEDGMFDGVCGRCEGEMSEADDAWDEDPSNPHRRHCGPVSGPERPYSRWGVSCVEDVIPF